MSARAMSIRALVLAALAVAISATPASGEPIFDLQLSPQAPIPVTHSDEHSEYTVAIENIASNLPGVGTVLHCNTSATGEPAPDLTYRWLREGDAIGGADQPAYTVTGEDEGASLQCEATATNDADGSENAYAPIGSASTSLPPVVVAPAPAQAKPSGSSTPTISGAAQAAAPSGTATVTAGSNTLTGVATATGTGTLGGASGTGTLVSGSKEVSAVSTATGAFAVGQEISGAGIAAAAGTGSTVAGSKEVKNLATASGAFAVGMAITGNGIPAGTAVVAAGPSTLELSAPATATLGGIALGPALIGKTLITKVEGTTLSLSTPAGASGPQELISGSKEVSPLSGVSGNFIEGNVIRGFGIAAASGTGNIVANSQEITGLNTTSGGFVVGMTLASPTSAVRGATVIKVTPTSLTLAKKFAGSASNVALTGMTTIASMSSNSLRLSIAASATGPQALMAGVAPFASGQKIEGAGIPPGTTITQTEGSNLVLSTSATASGSAVAISGTSEMLCTAPTGWSGEGLQWTIQWLRNGIPAPHPPSETTATTSRYVVEAADVSPPALLQCQATAKDASGNEAVSISNQISSNPLPPAPYKVPRAGSPGVSFSNKAEGPLSVELEFPGGAETKALSVSGSGWICFKQPPQGAAPASAACTRNSSLEPGGSYPPITAVTQVGRDAPDDLVTKARAEGGGAPLTAIDEDTVTVGPAVPFGFAAFETAVLDELADNYNQAGGHPFSAGAVLRFTEHAPAQSFQVGYRAANGYARVVRTDTPRGFVGNPRATAETCPRIDDIIDVNCPAGSVVGGVTLETAQGVFEDRPVYAIEPERGLPAAFGFGIASVKLAYTLVPELRAEDGYAISLLSAPVPKSPQLFGAQVTLCGFGAKAKGNSFEGCKQASEAEPGSVPLITNPTHCSGPPPRTKISADTWEEPDNWAEAQFIAPALTGCDQVDFEPQVRLEPTSRQADSPTGLDVEITMPTDGLQDPEGIAQANLANSTVTLPEGMAVNPSLANGLDACTRSQIGLGDNNAPTCPESSKIGAAEVETPLLEEPLKGSVYVAKQGDNPFHSLLALYLVFESKRYGLTIKVAGKVSPDPVTGQLTATFSENPEAPFSKLSLHFPGGNRAPLINPPACGSYGIRSELSPWSAVDPAHPTPGEIVTSTSTFQVDAGPGGGACPSGGLEAKLRAGLASPAAATTSPFSLRLSREDGSQRFRALSVAMPPGLTGYLRGIPYCPEDTLGAITSSEGSGGAELVAPACPASSQLGTVSAGAGAGAEPFYATGGRAYLAGPYKGAPLSIAIVTPAVAGPFDLGNVVIRSAVHIDPRTAQISAVSDPIPTILHGVLLDLRDIRVNIDRPDFILSPTNCEPMSIGADVTGESGGHASLSNRFQVEGCEKLGFKPNVKLQLHGGTKRGDYQRFIATVTARPGDANIASTAVTLPHSTFLAQEHINTVCTRVQFAADQCPQGSIYGHATAISPLVDHPLEGLAYLRSSDNPLPDLVVALRGPDNQPIEVDLSGRTDSVHGGIRNTFDLVPDAPVTKFVLEMKGGPKSLFVNSRDLCSGIQRATVRMSGQNGKRHDFRPLVGNDCSKKAGKPASKKHRKHRRAG